MKIDEEILSDIEHWWEGAESMVELSIEGMKTLRNAFFQALARLPENARETFLTESPRVICNENNGVACRYVIAVPPTIPADRQVSINFILIRHDAVSGENLVDIVAHEIAHVVRGDHKSRGAEAGEGWKVEKAADDLSESWGFRRCYSETMLAEMKPKK